jgi:hypothetical protein
MDTEAIKTFGSAAFLAAEEILEEARGPEQWEMEE